MLLIELAGAAGVLLATLLLGLVAHELAHAAVLRALGVPFDVEIFPEGEDEVATGLGVHRAWATVTPRSIPRNVSPGGLRLAALAPFVLATPLVLVLAGVLPDPLAAENVFLSAATVAWFGCALPSPRDFSLFWHAEETIDQVRGSTSGE